MIVMARARAGAQETGALDGTAVTTAAGTGPENVDAEIGESGSALRAAGSAVAAAEAVAGTAPETNLPVGPRAQAGSPGGEVHSMPWRPSRASVSSPRDSGQ